MNASVKEPLLRVEFGRDVLSGADDVLQFIVHELGAICERIPADLKYELAVAQKVRVTIELD